jgi:hypothetical protein
VPTTDEAAAETLERSGELPTEALAVDAVPAPTARMLARMAIRSLERVDPIILWYARFLRRLTRPNGCISPHSWRWQELANRGRARARPLISDDERPGCPSGHALQHVEPLTIRGGRPTTGEGVRYSSITSTIFPSFEPAAKRS